MKSIDPAIKFLTLMGITFVLAWRFDPLLNTAVFLCCMAGILCCGVKPKVLFAWMIPIFIAAIGMFFTGYRFSAAASMPVIASDFVISDSRVINGLAQGSRVLAYAGVGFLFTLTTDKIHLVRSFRRRFHVPQVFAYGLLAAWGIVPQMLGEYRRTITAFRARGLTVAPFSPAVLKPLLVKSVRWSEELSIAMESRGFDANSPRTEYEPALVKPRDILFLVVGLGATLAASFLL